MPCQSRQPPGARGHDDVALGLDIGVADLPIAALEVIDWTFAMRAGQDVQAAVIRVGVVEGDPDADDGGAQGIVEVCAVLVPGLFAAHRRLEQGHLLE